MILTRPNTKIGSSFELLILASQRNVVRLEHLPQCGAKFIGRGRVIKQRMPYDFSGVVVGKRWAIAFDAKACHNVTLFPVGARDHFPEHQRAALIRQGEGGAVAGLMVSAELHRTVYWLDWRFLQAREPSIRWDDPRLVLVAAPGKMIDFEQVVKEQT